VNKYGSVYRLPVKRLKEDIMEFIGIIKSLFFLRIFIKIFFLFIIDKDIIFIDEC